MSAVRRNDRRVNRSNLSLPYARPSKAGKAQQSKNSLWSLSGFISFLNPWGGNSEPEDSDFSGPSDGEIEQGPPPRPFSPPPPPPPPQQQLSSNSSRSSVMNGPTAGSSVNQPFSLNTSSPSPSGSSLAKHLEPVTRFLVEKAGQPLNEFEAAGIVDYIQKNVQGPAFVSDKPEPFRFSVSPSRAASPQTQEISNTQTLRKTLSRNPNGVYRWQGAGSSRPRNRYQSPGFAPRPQQHRIKLSPPKTPLVTDTKRRRVDVEDESLTPQKSLVPSAPTIRLPSPVLESPLSPHHVTGPSATSLNGKITVPSTFTPSLPVTPPKVNGIQPRIRTSGLPMKPTTPAIPSPLRQTWKESDSPPQASPPSRPTRAAGFMTELIKGVTPTKKPDVSNPYQTACPVKPPAPVRKPVAKRPKPPTKPAEKQEPELSAQAIIEATVPKGTKRSRPPPETEKSVRGEEVSDAEPFASTLNGSTRTTRSVVNVVETTTIPEDEESPSKRRKTPLSRPSPQAQEIDGTSSPKLVVRPAEIIEPVDDTTSINGKSAPQLPSTTLSPSTGTKSLFSSVKTAAPKEPSKLRYSIHADKVEFKSGDAVPAAPPLPPFFAPQSAAVEVKGADTVPAPFIPSLFAPPLSTVPKTTGASAEAKLLPKGEALAMGVDQLPKYHFAVGTTSSFLAGPSYSTARHTALSAAVASLPTYEFTTVIAPTRALNGFNWTAAGLKAPTPSAQTWTCSLCSLQNPGSAAEKCTICDAPRQATTDSSSPSLAPALAHSSFASALTAQPIAAVKSFDWSAAGITPPPKPESGTWMCSVCSLSNPASATDKCIVCETPR